MATPLVDCHTHTSFSDGESTFEENIRAAAKAGVRVLAATDHLTLPASMDPNCECQVPRARLAKHRAAFDEARRLASDIAPELEFVYGFECDWYPGCEDNVRAWSEGATFRLGSVHWIGNPGDVRAGAAGDRGTQGVPRADLPGSGAGWIDYAEDMHVWLELGPDEVWRRYVDAWCAACESPLDFDSMAHPDLPTRFANEGFAPTASLAPLWGRMAECVHDTQRHIEVSTAGLRKSTADYYPSSGLLAAFKHAEVPITVGSDAHCAEDIAYGIRDAYRHAAAAGYTSIDAPRADGGWQTFPLE